MADRRRVAGLASAPENELETTLAISFEAFDLQCFSDQVRGRRGGGPRHDGARDPAAVPVLSAETETQRQRQTNLLAERRIFYRGDLAPPATCLPTRPAAVAAATPIRP